MQIGGSSVAEYRLWSDVQSVPASVITRTDQLGQMTYAPEMPRTPLVTCPKCVELWREYADATRHHVGLLKEQEVSVEMDPLRLRDLHTETQLAGMRRDSVRAGIRVHLAVDHVDEPSLTVAIG
jgi:hypothetical protein